MALYIAQVSNIPPIMKGATWNDFGLDFFSDNALTVPMNLVGKPMWSQIMLPGDERRYDLICSTATANNRVDFSMDYDKTVLLPPGSYKWDILVETSPGVRDFLALGRISVQDTVTRVQAP